MVSNWVRALLRKHDEIQVWGLQKKACRYSGPVIACRLLESSQLELGLWLVSLVPMKLLILDQTLLL